MQWLQTAAQWIGIVVVLIVLLVIAIRLFAQPDETGSGGGGGGNIFGGFDEAFNPAQHNANLELERQRQIPVESPVPSDRMWQSGALQVEYDNEGNPTSITIRNAGDQPQADDYDLVGQDDTQDEMTDESSEGPKAGEGS